MGSVKSRINGRAVVRRIKVVAPPDLVGAGWKLLCIARFFQGIGKGPYREMAAFHQVGTGRPYREMAAIHDGSAKQPGVDADRIGMAGFCKRRALRLYGAMLDAAGCGIVDRDRGAVTNGPTTRRVAAVVYGARDAAGTRRRGSIPNDGHCPTIRPTTGRRPRPDATGRTGPVLDGRRLDAAAAVPKPGSTTAGSRAATR